MARQKITKESLKKNKKGEASQFVTRSKAIKKLQLKLRDFRRLCILKGIYPREPKKSKNSVSTRTYYHVKDISFLAHEKLLQKFRDVKIYLKKIKRAKIRGDTKKADKLVINKPQYSVKHLVKERYPTFIDAIRDLDDPLCLISLFSVLPTHKQLNIPRKKIESCIQLQREFNLYVIQSQSLKKAFLSIKGIYYQAEIMGQKVTWITPYQFTQNLPQDVDYRVMLTFLEFYEVLQRFVNFKLFQDINLNYPPDLNINLDSQQYNSYKSFIFKNNQTLEQLNQQKEQEEKYKISEQFQNNSEVQQITDKIINNNNNIFNKYIFWLNREVPRYSLEFIILAFGGQVYWDTDDQDQNIQYDSNLITHCITDREPEQIKFIKNREYIQPQWIYDCINNQIILPVKDYVPGKILPPHLSPFVNNEAEGYTPQRQKDIDNLLSGSNQDLGYNIEQEQQNQSETDQNNEEKDDNNEEEYESENDDIEVDEGFDFEKDQKKQKQQEKTDKQDNKQLAKAMLTKKKRRLLSRIEYSQEQKKQQATKLINKAKQIQNKLKVEKNEKKVRIEKRAAKKKQQNK